MAAGNLPPRIKVALTAVDRDGFRVDGEAGEWSTSKWVVQIQDGERVEACRSLLRACEPASLRPACESLKFEPRKLSEW
ncbi:hypothetical protein EV2_025623 [Malus domestica]